MDEEQRAEDEIAAAGISGKRFVSLIRFVSVLVDQTTEANLSPEEMRYVGAVFKNTIDLFALNQAK